MSYTVDVQNDAQYAANAERLGSAARTTLQLQGAPESALTIVITSDEAVATLNAQYRGIDSATDVLSFPADAPPMAEPDEPVYLGDLVVAYPYAKAQAEREGHALDDSLALLVVHGVLHLLGYDHDTPENRQAMWAAQGRALDALGISAGIVPALEGEGDHG
jgi:probable rRNA maturation factor